MNDPDDLSPIDFGSSIKNNFFLIFFWKLTRTKKEKKEKNRKNLE